MIFNVFRIRIVVKAVQISVITAFLVVPIKAFSEANNYLDFISVDGSERGTGSAPIEFTNYVGTPLMGGLAFVHKILQKFNLSEQVKIMTNGRVIDFFDVVKVLVIGADTVAMERSFMLSLGCMQARECNLNSCPIGVAIQDEDLVEALVVASKNTRVKNYYNKTITAVKELVSAIDKRVFNIFQVKMFLEEIKQEILLY